MHQLSQMEFIDRQPQNRMKLDVPDVVPWTSQL
jgi:hypothetical protein